MKKFINLTKKSICIINIFLIVCAIILVSSCDGNTLENQSNNEYRPKIFQRNAKLRKQDQVWERVSSNFDMTTNNKHANQHARVQHYVKQYGDAQLNNVGVRASPYLHYIIEEIEKRDMPGELALLPMIESAYETQATSSAKAAGLWQFIPSTGKMYGLKQDQYYDGRRDVKASTRAALDYLTVLHKEFDKNWMLALAAYNAGEGRIRKAIQKNKKKGKSTSFWELDLPKETKEYVPKLLALAEVVRKNKTTLPSIENKPYFEQVQLGKAVDLSKVAELADIEVKELKRLNAGYKKAATAPAGKGPQELLLPVENAQTLKLNLHKIK